MFWWYVACFIWFTICDWIILTIHLHFFRFPSYTCSLPECLLSCIFLRCPPPPGSLVGFLFGLCINTRLSSRCNIKPARGHKCSADERERPRTEPAPSSTYLTHPAYRYSHQLRFSLFSTPYNNILHCQYRLLMRRLHGAYILSYAWSMRFIDIICKREKPQLLRVP